MSIKKREIFPMLNDIIADFVAMGNDVAKLEYYNSDEASLRLKRAIVEINHGKLKNFHKYVISLREEISKPQVRDYKTEYKSKTKKQET
jgi:hypothetical protein